MRKKFTLIFILFATFSLAAQENNTKLAVDVKGGIAYMVAQVHESLSGIEKDHVKDLKSGKQFKATAHYYINPLFGLGFHYTRFGSKPVTPFSGNDIDGDGVAESGELKNDMKVKLYAPSLQAMLPLAGDKIYVRFEEAIGVLEYDNKYFYINNNFSSTQLYLYTAHNLGTYSSMGLAWKITKNIGFGIDLSALTGSFKKIKNYGNTIELEDRENVTRLNLEAGLTVFL